VALITLIIAVSYAGLERMGINLLFRFREARFRDVLVDSTGALLAQVLVWDLCEAPPEFGAIAGSQRKSFLAIEICRSVYGISLANRLVRVSAFGSAAIHRGGHVIISHTICHSRVGCN